MHELAITQGILDIALECARDEGAERIERINVAIGELTGVVEDCVRLYLSILSPGTAAEHAELVVYPVQAMARCQDCAKSVEIQESGWVCPGCRGTRLILISGRELLVESIEVSDGSEAAQGHS